MKRNETVADARARVEQIAHAAAARLGLDIVEVELKGAGKNQLLRITIDRADDIPGDDKPAGVTHEDCANISREVSAALDADDPIAGPYELEVSSPGVERKLNKWRDWERFRGQKAKIVLKEPAGELKFFDGVIAQTTEDHNITVDLGAGSQVTFAFEQVERANLKFEW